jgi:hypothetical protein
MWHMILAVKLIFMMEHHSMMLPRHSSLMVFFRPLWQLQGKQKNLKKETSEEEQIELDELELSEELSEEDDKLPVTELSLLSISMTIIYKKRIRGALGYY